MVIVYGLEIFKKVGSFVGDNTLYFSQQTERKVLQRVDFKLLEIFVQNVSELFSLDSAVFVPVKEVHDLRYFEQTESQV